MTAPLLKTEAGCPHRCRLLSSARRLRFSSSCLLPLSAFASTRTAIRASLSSKRLPTAEERLGGLYLHTDGCGSAGRDAVEL
jgi:hypothetical protein